mgnify:CR=1 FL=1|tara:strand:+ start:575 stop:1312 length:738 start_codon:yes stop_codon:yes gene_type:complete
MGFLRKVVRKVKKAVKKVTRGVKKVFKKIKKSKILKAIALVGAAIVTGGAFVGAYGGTMASSTVGSWLASTSANILATPVVGTLATPFKWLGSAAGNVAAGVFPPAAATPATPPPAAPPPAAPTPAASSGTPSTGSFFGHKTPNIIKGVEDVLKSEFVQDVGKGVLGGVATGYIMNELTEEDPVGAYGSGLGEERGLELTPLEIAYSQANIDINDAYKNLTYGNADTSFLYNTSEFAKSPMIGVA